MEYVFATLIALVCFWIAVTNKIHTDILCIHLLWVAATLSAIFVTCGNYNALIFSVLFVIISAMYWTVSEFFKVLAQIKS